MTRRHAPPLVQRDGAQPLAGDVQRLADAGVQGATSALPHLDRISRSFGPSHDLAGVQAQIGDAGAAASRAMGAQAYATRGDRVAFAATPSLRVAAHEAAHLVQQKGGLSLPGGVGRTGDAHERHADAVADRVAAGRPAGDLLQHYARPQAKGASNALQPLAKASSAGPGQPGVQMWKLAMAVAPWMTKTGQVDAAIGGKATVGRAKNLKMRPAAVGVVAPGAGASPAAVKPKSWGQLQAWNLVHANPPGYVRMHLIHDWLGGSGMDVNNLAPGTNTMNQRHLHKVEKPLMTALFNGGRVFQYTVTASYQKGGGGLAKAKAQKVWRNTLRKIACNATYEPLPGAGKKNLHKTINEVAGITALPNWLGH